MTRTISVVVRSYNGAERLGRCLDALRMQSLPVEVLVVDDGSSDATASVAKSHGVNVVSHDRNRGIAASRNTGIATMKSDIVAFCDDDCEPGTDWTLKLSRVWEGAPTGTSAIGGTISVPNPSSLNTKYLSIFNPAQPLEIELLYGPSFWYRIRRQFWTSTTPDAGLRPVFSMIGANMSFDRLKVHSVGGFDEGLFFSEGEEAQIANSLRQKFGDETVLVDPGIEMPHYFRPRLRDTFKRSFVSGIGIERRWRKQGGLPSLRFSPAIVSLVFLANTPWSLEIAALAALATCYLIRFWGLIAGLQRFGPVAVLLPVVAVLDDVVCDLGFVSAIFQNWTERAESSAL